MVGRVPQRRKLVWATQAVNTGAIAIGANFVVDLLAALEVAGASTLGATVMRTHLTISSRWTTQTTGASFWAGLKVADRNEAVATIPLPTNTELDWALITQVFAHFTGAAVDTAQQTIVDLKSKRKVEEMGTSFYLFMTNSSGVAQTYDIFSRTLLALP